jgi:predicted Abi (CAAX) family protease
MTVIGSAVKRRARDVRDAVATWPGASAWRRCLYVYLLFLAAALPLGLTSGLLHAARAPLDSGAAAVVAVLLFLRPALVEELLFRALLLPRRPSSMGRGRLALTVTAAVALYVAAHPLNALAFRPSALGVFDNPFYLAITTLLGLACSAAYLISGSVWPPVVIHGTTVTLWILYLGGWRLLNGAV